MQKLSSRLVLHDVLHLVISVILVVLFSQELGAPSKALNVKF